MKKKTTADCKDGHRGQPTCGLNVDELTHLEDTLKDEVAVAIEAEVFAEPALLVELGERHEDVVVDVAVEEATKDRKVKTVSDQGAETQQSVGARTWQ